MSGDGDATHFTLLGQTGALGVDGLTERYAYPENPSPCWVRGNMITSVDGGATSGGKSGGLGADGDRAVFAALRELADVILVGAATVRTENYSGVQFSAAQRLSRQRRGQSEVPPIAVLTRSGVLERDAKLFHRTEVPPLILTSSEAVADTGRRLGGLAEVVDASGGRPGSVDLRTALSVLADRGLRRVLAEGGPGILGMLVEEALLDELCLTIAPVLVGGRSPRIVSGPGEVHTPLRLRDSLADDDGYLFLRYTRS
ncbi:pyrimidine reductase, riboflavin biosynthesis [Mycolicibacterium chubuense NBB4]|uniref:Pyrimidine reductase, riboflavin biosynthesis n=1 Tax=Mycolicibacterium chubuense (strain NBB4) TaxID=710421 RepID=I4BI62_MYCCN|nr:pyrimidine reductase family protein [Mycolicibacterium chubuense]AFM16969.1 pyrimidine reductase, riboflavin biosynthesis [Mycolicibacterium chubuense NBB4]